MTTWQRADVASVESDERAAVLALSGQLNSPPFILEAQAAVIWQALGQEPRAENAIVEEVAAHYGLDPELIRQDVAQFLVELESQGLATR